MMPNDRSQYYSLYRLTHIAEYSVAAQSYRENNRDETNLCSKKRSNYPGAFAMKMNI